MQLIQRDTLRSLPGVGQHWFRRSMSFPAGLVRCVRAQAIAGTATAFLVSIEQACQVRGIALYVLLDSVLSSPKPITASSSRPGSTQYQDPTRSSEPQKYSTLLCNGTLLIRTRIASGNCTVEVVVA